MAYDPGLQAVVLFGGSGGPSLPRPFIPLAQRTRRL
jgi:hypothetical protein